MKLLLRKAHVARLFQKATLRTKIIAVVMSTVFLVLVFSGTAWFANVLKQETRRLTQGTIVLAKVISSNSSAALAFGDAQVLNEILGSTRWAPSIVSACVFDASGKLAGAFSRSGDSLDSCPALAPPTDAKRSYGRLRIQEPILVDGKEIGRLMVTSDYRNMYSEVRAQAVVDVLVVISSLLFAWVVSRGLQRLISGPILELASFARMVSDRGDYMLRAQVRSEDELATLAEAFNHVLARVEQHDRNREKLLDEFRQAVRARDEFMFIASHELRTPLTPLKTQVQTLRRVLQKGQLETLPKGHIDEVLRSMDRQVSRLDHLVGDLLDVTRISSGRMTLAREPMDLGLLVREIAERMQSEIQASGSQLKLMLEDQKSGDWDRLRIDQVITNLLTNAIKYGLGKPITVLTRTVGERAELRVRDEGMGIAPEDQARVFQRFERAVSSGHFGGLGLGLYICGKIVEAHHGTIRVESQLGGGATFIVELPLNSPHR